VAWVLYNDGQLFRASIIDASCAPATETTGITDGTLYGMGFVTDKAGGDTERLFVSPDDGAHALEWLDTAQRPATWQRAAVVTERHASNPELPGPAHAKPHGT